MYENATLRKYTITQNSRASNVSNLGLLVIAPTCRTPLETIYTALGTHHHQTTDYGLRNQQRRRKSQQSYLAATLSQNHVPKLTHANYKLIVHNRRFVQTKLTPTPVNLHTITHTLKHP